MTFHLYRKAGRCANGAERDTGSVFHAVPKSGWIALCGEKPGRHSGGWANEGVEGGPSAPTCPSCARLVEIVAKMKSAGGLIERWPGGFWTVPGMTPRAVESGYRVPEWSVTNGAQVLRALAKRGFVVEDRHEENRAGRFVVQYKLAEDV